MNYLWRCLRFIDSFKGKRVVDISSTHRLMKKIQSSTNNIIEEMFIPALEFAPNDEVNKNLMGIAFIKYNEKYDSLIRDVLRDNRINMTEIVKEEVVENMRNNSKSFKIEKDKFFKVGDSVQIVAGDYKNMIGRIEFINETNVVVNVQIFGRDHSISLELQMIHHINF